MKKIIIGWIFLILSLNAFTKIDFEKDYFDFLKDVKEVSFKIKSTEINQLIQQKLLLDTPRDIFAQINWTNGKVKVEIKNIEGISENSIKRIQEVFESKVKLVIQEEFQQWIEGFELQKIQKPNVFHYEDESGLLDRSDITIVEKKKAITITEKIPTGQIETEYIYTSPPWARGEKVLTRVVRKKSEENQIDQTDNDFIYEKFQNNRWMLSKVSSKSNQQLNTKSDKPINRKIAESFSFYDYEIVLKE